MKSSLVLGLLVGICFFMACARPGYAQITDQINKTVTLSPGANVKISGINGSVNLETTEGNQAEIKIDIRASDREALERRPLLVENTPDSLTIRTLNDREGGRGGDRGWVKHEVFIKMPRQVNLKVNGVNGPVQVGEITGSIGVNGINGRVEVLYAGAASEIGGINGQTTISIAKLGPGGLKVSGINGRVELGLPTDINANVDVSGVNGGVNSDIPLAVIGEMRRGQLKGTLGSGGASIAISGINGGVHLKRN
jgi:hypothetical protein